MFDHLLKSEHQRIEEMLSAYLDGELSPKEQARVQKHLAQCAHCARNLHTLHQTVALLGQLPPVAVPRSFAIRPVQVAQRPSVLPVRRTYAYLRAATVLATVVLAMVLAGDVFLTGLAPYLAPARAPEIVVREVPVEKVVVETVVAEKEVVVTVEVEREIVVEKESVYAATPSPAPAEKREEVQAAKPLATPAVVGEVATGAAPPFTPEVEALTEAPLRPDEGRIEATSPPAEAIIAAEPTFTPAPMPTAIAEALPPTPVPQEPTARGAVRPSRPGVILLRAVEAGLLALVLVLAIATLVARRRQSAR